MTMNKTENMNPNASAADFRTAELTGAANNKQTPASKPVRILAVETSCDETSAAVVENGKRILSNVVSSQVDTHRMFGGVVPEVASRKHVEAVTWIIEEALREAGMKLSDVSAVAVTQGPGLVGSLLVGMVAAKALALSAGLPFIGVHHIAGHIYANGLEAELKYPLLALVVSGGHTELIYMKNEGSFEVIGQTRDDAVGEAYDKVGRALGLPYPGGPHIDRLAQEAATEIELPRSWLEAESYDFSFSGLKTAVMTVLNKAKMKGEPVDEAALARGFQTSAIDVLTVKTMRAAAQYGVRQVVLAGGVAANRGLRVALRDCCSDADLELLVPPLSLCTDNAAMIAAAAFLKYNRGQFTPLDMKAEPLLSLEKWMTE